MPIYEYRCLSGEHQFELLRPMAQANDDAPCLHCQGRATRRVSVFATVVKGENAGMERAMEDQGQGSVGGGCPCGGACTCSAARN